MTDINMIIVTIIKDKEENFNIKKILKINLNKNKNIIMVKVEIKILIKFEKILILVVNKTRFNKKMINKVRLE